ncbi:MAG: type II secretion system minor pseudopilin GspK, partial [Bradyrhizobium sp.]
MRPPIRPIAQSSERGFVIVAVLWILVALSTLAMIFSVYLSNSARALGATDIGVESEALVSASLELAAYQLLSADEKARPAQGSFRFRMDDAAVLATFTSEA